MFQNDIINQLGGLRNFQQRLTTFKQQLDQGGSGNYQEMVQRLIDAGQMTQEQFNQFRAIANQITGRNI